MPPFRDSQHEFLRGRNAKTRSTENTFTLIIEGKEIDLKQLTEKTIDAFGSQNAPSFRRKKERDPTTGTARY